MIYPTFVQMKEFSIFDSLGAEMELFMRGSAFREWLYLDDVDIERELKLEDREKLRMELLGQTTGKRKKSSGVGGLDRTNGIKRRLRSSEAKLRNRGNSDGSLQEPSLSFVGNFYLMDQVEVQAEVHSALADDITAQRTAPDNTNNNNEYEEIAIENAIDW